MKRNEETTKIHLTRRQFALCIGLKNLPVHGTIPLRARTGFSNSSAQSAVTACDASAGSSKSWGLRSHGGNMMKR